MRRLFRILFAGACAVCIACVVLLFRYYRENQQGSEEYQNILGRVVAVRQFEEQSEEQPNQNQNTENHQQAGKLKNPPALLVDFEELRRINEDTIAWIDFPGQQISYPVVQGTDNDHYLKYTFEGNRNAAGCIFMDSRNQGILTDDNTIIYGHNMRNGSMFGLLKQYMEREHYEKFPYFDLYLPEAVYRCRILICCRVPARGENYPTRFTASLERNQFISDMRARAAYEIDPQDPNVDVPLPAESYAAAERPADAQLPLVMLSTCVGGQSKYRFVILAEAVKVD